MKISTEYVKQSYSLSWSFFSKNIQVSIALIAILFASGFLLLLPKLGLLFSMLFGTLFFSVQTYIAKMIINSENEEEFDRNVSEMRILNVISRYLSVGAGAYLGVVMTNILIFGGFVLLFISVVGADKYELLIAGTLPVGDIYGVYMKIAAIGSLFVLVVSALIYIFPMALAKAYESEDFFTSLKSFFFIISLSAWKASFKEKYFVLISMLHLSASVTLILFLIFISTVVLSPIAVFVAYIFCIYLTVVSVMAKEVSFVDHA